MNRSLVVLLLLCAGANAAASSLPPARAEASENPFLKPYGTPFDVPPFDRIRNEHFLPAIEEGILREKAEVAAIADNPEPPTFANTVAALDHAGILLSQVTAVFGGLQGAHTNKELQALARKTAPMMAAHRDDIGLNEKLFRRIKAVYDARASLKLDREELFLLENGYKGFVRGGALLDEKSKARLREINKELSLLSVKFGENVLAETNAFKLAIEDEADLAGLPDPVRTLAAEEAKGAGLEGKWLFTIQVPSMTPFLQYSERRDLRERLHRAYFMKGDNDDANDNKANILGIIALRQEKARLLGYKDHAAFILEENMAKDAGAVSAFLDRLWKPTLAKMKAEAAELQALVDRRGGGYKLESWDWWNAAEKLRQEKYALDDGAVRPYLRLESVRDGFFALCGKLYGLTFTPRTDLPVYHPEVQTFEVKEADGAHVGILYMDFHPRESKRAGAWSGGFRRSYVEDGKRVPPIATVVCNLTRPTPDAPSLISPDEVETIFHEGGHALATLLSRGRFRDRTVARDSVELPSQIMENWAFTPELLSVYAKHYKTGEAIPSALVDKLERSSLFNQGFVTGEYLAASILDIAWHTLPDTAGVDVRKFESDAMARIGLIPEIKPRYRSTYFSHIFSGGYSAGYYVYIWAEVLDQDAFEAFKEKGLFDRETATSFRKNILEPFGTDEPMAQYIRFRGREPEIGPLLRNRGLDKE